MIKPIKGSRACARNGTYGVAYESFRPLDRGNSPIRVRARPVINFILARACWQQQLGGVSVPGNLDTHGMAKLVSRVSWRCCID